VSRGEAGFLTSAVSRRRQRRCPTDRLTPRARRSRLGTWPCPAVTKLSIEDFATGSHARAFPLSRSPTIGGPPVSV
jgi:hypothetical protein